MDTGGNRSRLEGHWRVNDRPVQFGLGRQTWKTVGSSDEAWENLWKPPGGRDTCRAGDGFLASAGPGWGRRRNHDRSPPRAEGHERPPADRRRASRAAIRRCRSPSASSAKAHRYRPWRKRSLKPERGMECGSLERSRRAVRSLAEQPAGEGESGQSSAGRIAFTARSRRDAQSRCPRDERLDAVVQRQASETTGVTSRSIDGSSVRGSPVAEKPMRKKGGRRQHVVLRGASRRGLNGTYTG